MDAFFRRTLAAAAATAALSLGMLVQRPAAADTASPAPSAATVDTKDFVYSPTPLSVAVGQKVTFKNSDTVAHTVTAEDKSFDSGDMQQGKTWSHVFTKAGTYTYTCAYHSFMHGSIVVK
jgi:plastocyanin